jgi:putative hemolysin
VHRRSVQVRRITVGEISDDAPGTPLSLSFTKMMSVASNFVIPEPKNNAAERSNFLATAKATYCDETGEEITMSTDSELNVAFAQHLNGVANNAHFRVIVSIPKD